MFVKSKGIYEITCDNEPCPLEASSTFSIADKAVAKEMAKEEGWVFRKGKTLCPDCAAEKLENKGNI